MSKTDFVGDANLICAKATTVERAGITATYNDPVLSDASTEGEAIQFEVTKLVPILIEGAEAKSQGIGRLTPPSGDEDRIEAILDAYAAWIVQAERTPLKPVVANDVYNEARKLTGDYGLAQCEKNPFEE